MTSIDEIQLLLDDHLLKSLTMLGSPFIKPLELEMREWSSRLQMIQDILEEWLKVRFNIVYAFRFFVKIDIYMNKQTLRFKRLGYIWNRFSARKI